MKQNVMLLLATFVLIVVCVLAIINPKHKAMADGGGGGPIPPCGTVICPAGPAN